MTTHRAEQPVPDYVPGHDLLAGKVVVVTAAAREYPDNRTVRPVVR